MTSDQQTSRPARGPLMQWLARANAELSGWAAGTSWWRLIVLFLVVLIAGNLISEQLHLKHQRVVVATSNKDAGVHVTRVGPDGIRITLRRDLPGAHPGNDATERQEAPAVDAEGGPEVPAPPGVPRPPGPRDGNADEDEADTPTQVTRNVFTFRGLIGDLGATLIIVLFAYLAASKVVVRKVALADAKERTA